MPKPTHSRRFLFHGNATPFGARILSIGGKPHFDPVEGPPTAALGVVGGLQRGVDPKGSSYGDIFRWGATHAESKGEVRDGHHVTTVISTISDFSAKNKPFVFKAKKLSVTLVADHGPEGEPSIVPSEITLQGLELDGQPIEIEVDDDLSKFPTFAAFEKQYRRNQDFFDKYQAGRALAGKYGERLPRTEDGYAFISIVRSILWKKKKIKGHILPLKGFGKIHFGEVLMKSNRRRVTLVRLAMGSDTEADASCACVEPNGSWGH
jgi:hypothetical protein